jgi:histone-lysine N-methyltransferase SETMAR
VYINTLKTWQKRCRKFRPHKNIAEILLPFGNSRPPTSLKTQEANTELKWTVLPHPPHSPDLALSDFHLFGALKDVIRGKRFVSDDGVIEEVAASTQIELDR